MALTTDQFREASKARFTCPDCGWFCIHMEDHDNHQSCNGELFGKHHTEPTNEAVSA